MDSSLRTFVYQFAGVVATTLFFVLLVTFIWVPIALNGFPGEPRHLDGAIVRHMT